MWYISGNEVNAMILYLGDSLTRGIVGWSYIRFMPKEPYKNGGLDGDTAHGALRRLHVYRKTKWYPDVGTVVVGIGTNDLLQPFLMGRALIWRLVFGWRRGWKRWADEKEYAAVMDEIVDQILADGKRCVLMGLPLMQLRDYPLQELEARNAIVKKLALAYSLPFADVMGAELAAVPDAGRDYDFGKLGLSRLGDILLMGLFPRTKDGFSRRRGLELTVDGVHFNTRSARLAAETVQAAALGKGPEGARKGDPAA